MSWNELLEEKFALATALDIVGDRWSLMILAGSFYEARRFNDLERALGINRNLLSQRLSRLTQEGLLVKRLYQDKPARYEYCITPRGLSLRPAIISLTRWGQEHFTKDQTPVHLVHKTCGGQVRADIICDGCEEFVAHEDVTSHVKGVIGEHIRKNFLMSLGTKEN